MKIIFSTAIIFFFVHGFAQSPAEAEILKLSGNIFSWEVENNFHSLEKLLSDKFEVVTSRGEVQTKEQYLTVLRSGNVKHDSIIVEQSTVTITGKTAILIGKGWFHMTAMGNHLHRHLRYMEVFAKEDKEWKLIALYAGTLPDE